MPEPKAKQLKPCPFCGKEPTVYECGSNHVEWVVYCDKCDDDKLNGYDKEPPAIDAWNSHPAHAMKERLDKLDPVREAAEKLVKSGAYDVSIGSNPTSGPYTTIWIEEFNALKQALDCYKNEEDSDA